MENNIQNLDIVEANVAEPKVVEVNVVDKNSVKYQTALKFINKLLVNMGKDQIDDLKEFKNIDRTDIITDINKQVVLDMLDDIFDKNIHDKDKYNKDKFDKDKCGYYRRNRKYYITGLIRKMCDELGLKVKYTEKKIQKNTVSRTQITYSIV